MTIFSIEFFRDIVYGLGVLAFILFILFILVINNDDDDDDSGTPPMIVVIGAIGLASVLGIR